MLIRQETREDYAEVRELVKAAFEGAEHTDGGEYLLVDKLRASNGFVKELALIAEGRERIEGHIMFTEAMIGEHKGLALAPLSVLPGAQKKGIGTALMKRAHEIAKEMGYKFCVVVGSDTYYPRVGYKVANNYGIFAPFDIPKVNFMVLFFDEDTAEIKGMTMYAKELLEG